MSNDEPPATRYPDLDTSSRELARRIGAMLRQALASRGRASLVLSGGKTPLKLFDALRLETLEWSRVSIALADERWVPASDPDSNEKLLRDHLLRDAVATAPFSGLKNTAPTPDLGAAAAWETFVQVPRPFDVVVLGMGDDGHTASLFPESPNLSRALDPTVAAGCIGMRSPSAPHDRLSLNLTALLDSRHLFVLISGESKWQVYVAASRPGPVEEMPVRAVLRQQRTPHDVIWSP